MSFELWNVCLHYTWTLLKTATMFSHFVYNWYNSADIVQEYYFDVLSVYLSENEKQCLVIT